MAECWIKNEELATKNGEFQIFHKPGCSNQKFETRNGNIRIWRVHWYKDNPEQSTVRGRVAFTCTDTHRRGTTIGSTWVSEQRIFYGI